MKEKLINLKNKILGINNLQDEKNEFLTLDELNNINVKDFDLEVILSFTLGITDILDEDPIISVSKQLPLVWFLYPELAVFDTIEPHKEATKEIVEHLLNLYPELKNIKYDGKIDIKQWLEIQKHNVGEVLPVCKFGMSLDEVGKNEKI